VDSWTDEELDFVPDRAKRSRTIIITGRPERSSRPAAALTSSERDQRFFREAAAAAPAARLQRQPQRRQRRGAVERAGHRPDRIALWAFVLGVLVVLIAATSSDAASVGTKPLAMGSSGAGVKRLQVELSRLGYLKASPDAVYGRLTRTAVRRYQRSRCLKVNGKADRRTLTALRSSRAACTGPGSAKAGESSIGDPSQFGSRVLATGATGDDVTVLQLLLAVPQTGTFDAATLQAVKTLQTGAGLAVDGVVGQTTAAAIGARMTSYGATWYGPGLFGNRTACGQVLTETLQGVAHRTLPCGTKVTLFYNGRFRTVPVVDRGSFSASAAFDLTSATAKSIGMVASVTLRAAY
jgi:peptidoglycan hydrolase-like protein with peptidoglycan-binding domain